MTYEVVADRDRAVAFCRRRFPISVTPYHKGLCQLKDGQVIAAIVYDECNGSNIMAHAAATGRKWLNRWFLHEMFKYPFVTCGCQRITLPIAADNEDANRFAKHLGFRREAVLQRAAGQGQDLFLYVMFREDCRYA